MPSTWINTAIYSKRFASLHDDISADVCIIGGGITGATAAYLLSKAGKNVVLIMRGTTDDSTTAHTTGFLNAPIDTSLVSLAKIYGEDTAFNIWRAGFWAIDKIEELVQTEHIQCEFVRCDQYFYANDESEWESIKLEDQLALRGGFPVGARHDSHLVFPNEGYMVVKNQAKFHALDYVNALLHASKRMGARIFENTEAINVRSEGSERIVETKGGAITARDVFLATYYPFIEPKELMMHTGPYSTYIIEAQMTPGILPEAMYQDEHNPYHYFRVDAMDGHDRLIMGGEDHRRELKIDPEKSFKALEEYMRDRLHNIEFKETMRWHWGIIEPVDGLPFIGPIKSDAHQYVATGYSGTGLTQGTLAAEIISDSILGQPNGWAYLYKEDRSLKPKALVIKGKEYVGEFLGGAAKNVFKRSK